jgi:ubiquinol-cytochrome c reductase iron-sulfur subunit
MGSVAMFPSTLTRSFATLEIPTPKVDPYEVPKAPAVKVGGDRTKREFAYFVMGTSKFLYGTAARVAVVDILSTMSASKDVLALASVEVDLSQVEVGQQIVVKWRGKPLFIRHRTEADIADAQALDISELRDPQTDAERVKGDPKYLIMLGVCTHLGCVPMPKAGDYGGPNGQGGWFCPCHGSHYDTSGRIRRGPAPLNLEIPPYKYTGESTVLVG